MVDVGSASGRAEDAFIGFARTDGNIERICQECSEKAKPPAVILLTSGSSSNSLLGVSMEFLERGQSLACPGLPLAGAAFDPEWGFGRAEIDSHRDGSADFRLPLGHFEFFTRGDTWGYRLCPLDSHELPGVLTQLAHIRSELAKPRQRPVKEACVTITVSVL